MQLMKNQLLFDCCVCVYVCMSEGFCLWVCVLVYVCAWVAAVSAWPRVNGCPL